MIYFVILISVYLIYGFVAKNNSFEKLNEEEFIEFVINNHGKYDKLFKKEGIGGERMDSSFWSTKKYRIKSTYNDNESTEAISIYRKSDNEKIFSGGWGYSEGD